MIKATLGRAQWAADRWPVAGIVEVDVAGQRFRLACDADDNLASALFYQRASEQSELRAWTELLPLDGSTILDVGANTGVYSLLSARLRPESPVIAVEPNPFNLKRLQQNVRLNQVESVEILAEAAASRVGTAALSVPSTDRISDVSSLSLRFSEAHYGIEYRQEVVPVTTIDAIAKRLCDRPVGLIKIDVESYELPVLLGAVETLAAHGPPVLCEVVDPRVFCAVRSGLTPADLPGTREGIETLLAELDYEAFRVTAHGVQKTADLTGGDAGIANFLFIRRGDGREAVPWQDVRTLQRRQDRSSGPTESG